MKRIALALITALFAFASFAQQSFVLERIDVNGAARPAIIRAETRLATGRTYTNDDLDHAVYRVRRLPFVDAATYTLLPGSGANTRVMQISVSEQERFNYNADLSVLGIHSTGGANATESLGYRFFPGQTGVFDVRAGGSSFSSGSSAPSGSFSGIGVSYSAYGLFGTGAYATVGISTHTGGGGANPSLAIGVPVGITQTLRLSYQRNDNRPDTASSSAVEWIFDQTDDPFFGRHGLMLSVGATATKQHDVADFVSGHFPSFFHLHSEVTFDRKGPVLAAAYYRPLATQSAAWTRFSISNIDEKRHTSSESTTIPFHESRFTVSENNLDFLIGLAHNFERSSGDQFRRGRIEAGIGYHSQDLSSSLATFHATSDHGPQVNVGIAYRSQRGVFRINLSYVAD